MIPIFLGKADLNGQLMSGALVNPTKSPLFMNSAWFLSCWPSYGPLFSRWIGYEHENFRGRQYLWDMSERGEYNCYDKWCAQGDHISSVRAVKQVKHEVRASANSHHWPRVISNLLSQNTLTIWGNKVGKQVEINRTFQRRKKNSNLRSCSGY